MDVEKRLPLFQEQIVQVDNLIQELEAGRDASFLVNTRAFTSNVIISFPDYAKSSVKGRSTEKSSRVGMY
jgi:hypothetical protein